MEKETLAGVRTYEEAVEYIMSTPKFTSKNSMENTRLFWKHLGYPSQNKKIIHVAGTNGKGSVCAYLRAIFEAAGIGNAMFISPHLVDIRERFVTGDEMVSEEAFLEAFGRVRSALQNLPEELEKAEYHPTFFEFLFFMAMLLFDTPQVEYIILETGLGGRLDATNVVEHKEVCVITQIGYDHMEYLGNTLEEIAGEKAGILRRETPAVYIRGFGADKKAVRAIENAIKTVGAEPAALEESAIKEIKIQHKTIDFSMYINYDGYVSFTAQTTACYQVENAALAIKAAGCLKDRRITVSCMQEGIRNMAWAGRMEEILPGVYLDSAHNIDGIRAFLYSVSKHPAAGKRRLLYSVVKDKQYEAVIREIAQSGLFEEAALVELEDARALPISTLENSFGQYTQIRCTTYETLEKALRELIDGRGGNDCVYIVGSLYLVGEVKALLRRSLDDQF